MVPRSRRVVLFVVLGLTALALGTPARAWGNDEPMVLVRFVDNQDDLKKTECRLWIFADGAVRDLDAHKFDDEGIRN